MKPLLLRFCDATLQGPFFHLTTVEWGRNRLPAYHTHDYPEVFWITRGNCAHLINGRQEDLQTGDVVLMRASDAHQLSAIAGKRFRFTNLSLSPELFASLCARFPDEVRFLYRESDQPRRKHLPSGQLESLSELGRDLAGGAHTLFAIERMVMNVWNLFLRQAEGHHIEGPDWLRDALLQIEEAELFTNGVAAFVRLCGRSHAHVTRECKLHLGRTPTEIINTLRLRHASRLLRMTSRSVLEVSGDCGFENPAHFHRLFRGMFGTTPKRFREL